MGGITHPKVGNIGFKAYFPYSNGNWNATVYSPQSPVKDSLLLLPLFQPQDFDYFTNRKQR